MGKPPAAIFIARHGARLDAANKDWHLTSSTPYDTPLSYGGWLQSRALGARIINEVRALEEQLDQTSQGNHEKIQPRRAQERKQKRRIIIHTSPFLRCVQTAIAISSGISQNYNDIESLYQYRAPPGVPSNDPSSNSNKTNNAVPEPPQNAPRCLIRVDACLGEWLNPEYYEVITPPPKSEKMVASAKTELLRRDEGVIPVADTQPTPSGGHFPGGWHNLNTTPEEEEQKPEVESTPTTVNGSGQRNRAVSHDSLGAPNTPWGRRMLKINTDLAPANETTYAPPVPSYAISPSNPIPDGYVTHARDACALVDYQWDSMREPQNWGNGGEYGDEWSTMLARFRNSIGHIISWYQNDSAPTVPSHRRTRSQLQVLSRDEDDSAVDTILILVSHGAGCNALIGALSGEPALVNVPTASLTFAARKDCLKSFHQNGVLEKNNDLNQKASPEGYALVEVASTDHLRPGTSPSISHRSSSVSSLPSPSIPSYRHRSTISSGPVLMGLPSLTSPRTPSGLWKSFSGDTDGADDLLPSLTSPFSASSPIAVTDGASDTPVLVSGDLSSSGQPPQRTMSQRGLWRSAPLNKERSSHSSRRWTVAERPL